MKTHRWEERPGVCGFCGAKHERDPKHKAGDKAEPHYREKVSRVEYAALDERSRMELDADVEEN